MMKKIENLISTPPREDTTRGPKLLALYSNQKVCPSDSELLTTVAFNLCL